MCDVRIAKCPINIFQKFAKLKRESLLFENILLYDIFLNQTFTNLSEV